MTIWTDKLIKETFVAAFGGDANAQKKLVDLVNNLRWHLGDQAQSLMEPCEEINALLGEESTTVDMD